MLRHLEGLGHEVIDHGGSAGTDRPYYAVADEVAAGVSAGALDRAILFCGTGMGMAIVANKRPGVYAAVCETKEAAVTARSINDANVLTLGGMLTAPARARAIVDAFLVTEFKQGWGPEIAAFLDEAQAGIRALEQRGAAESGRKT